MVSAHGAKKAPRIRALCNYMLWGKTTGAAIASVRSAPLSSSLSLHLAHVFYSPLFFLVTVTGQVLSLLPALPDVFGKALGCVLVGLIGTHVVPLGIVGAPFYMIMDAM